MRRFILATGLLYIFTVTYTYSGTLKFDKGTKIQSHLLSVSSYAVPVVVKWWGHKEEKKDLLVGDGYGNVWQYRNFGTSESPNFTYGGSKITNVNVRSRAVPTVIDWDGQYYLDLIVGDANGNLSLFLSKSIPTPENAPEFDTKREIPGVRVPGNASPYVYDWNEDGLEDLIIGDANGNIWVYLNVGRKNSPVFGTGSRVLGTNQTPLDVGEDAIPIVVNWNNEGNKDLVVGNRNGEIYVFLSDPRTPTGTPTFTTGTRLQTTDNRNIDVGFNATPFIVNWDNDGDIDLVVGEEDGSINLFINNSTNDTIRLLPSSKIAGKPTPLDAGQRIIPFIIDFNNDDRKDLIVGDTNGYVKLYLNSGENNNPVFTDAYIFQIDRGTPTKENVDVGNNASPYVYDWNNDDKKDLIVGNSIGYIYIFTNVGSDNSPIFRPGTIATTGTGTNPPPLWVKSDATPTICDWNNDGLVDLVVGNRHGEVCLYINSGSVQRPIFPSVPEYIKANNSIIDVGDNAKPYVVDFDNDKDKDLVIGNKNGNIVVYLNVGDDSAPIFTTQQRYFFHAESNSNPLKVPSGYASPVMIDWNEDGIYDLIVGEENGHINIYRGIYENSKPEVTLITPRGTQSKSITINYILKDDEGDICSIEVEFSTDGGNSWKTATPEVNSGDGVLNLNSSKNGVKHSFVWDSEKDLERNFVGEVIIKITPYDGMVRGNSNKTDEFRVDNKNPPKWQKIKLNGADLNLDTYSTPVVADWDEDGRRDILIGSEDGYIYFLKNENTDESPRFNVAVQLQAGNTPLKVNNYSSPFVYNWNSTGGDDLLVGDGDGYVTFFENRGQHLNLAPGRRIMVGRGNNPLYVPGNAVPVVVDWNRDGYKDLVVGDKSGDVWLFLNDATSHISPVLLPGVRIRTSSNLNVGNNATPYIIDWDRDDRDDLIIGNKEGYIFYYRNIGSKGTPSFRSGSKIKFKGEEIKIDGNSRPFVLSRDKDNIDLIIGSEAGYVFLYPLSQVAINTPPQLSITDPKGTQSRQVGNVIVTYTLQDEQWDSCDITVEYSEDGQYWYLATGTPKSKLESSPEGIEHTFTWFSRENLPFANDKPIHLRFIPSDWKSTGNGSIVSFILDNLNRPPRVTNVVCKPTGEFGQVEIFYDLQDADNDLCRVLVEYQGGSKGNTWATATVVGTTTGIIPSKGLKLVWLSAIDEKNQSADNYVIRITPFDIEYGTYGISTSFAIDNSSLSSVIVPRGTVPTKFSFSPLTIEILKPFSNDFDVLITVEKDPKGIPPMNTLASLDNTIRKITAVKLPDMKEKVSTPIKLTIEYTDLGSYEIETLLRIFKLWENRWVVVEGEQLVDVVNNRITVQLEHFSVFRIGVYAPTLKDFSVSPNPFKDNDGIKENGELGAGGDYEVVIFRGVSKVKIYTIAGELVRKSKENEIDESGMWRWDLKNDYGRLVSSGIYIYVAKDKNGASVVGRLGVIR